MSCYNCVTCGNPCGVGNGVWVLSRDYGARGDAEVLVSIHITQESAEAAEKTYHDDVVCYYVKHWPVMPRTPEP